MVYIPCLSHFKTTLDDAFFAHIRQKSKHDEHEICFWEEENFTAKMPVFLADGYYARQVAFSAGTTKNIMLKAIQIDGF